MNLWDSGPVRTGQASPVLYTHKAQLGVPVEVVCGVSVEDGEAFCVRDGLVVIVIVGKAEIADFVVSAEGVDGNGRREGRPEVRP